MKQSRFTEALNMSMVHQAEGGISSVTFYKWRAKYGGLD